MDGFSRKEGLSASATGMRCNAVVVWSRRLQHGCCDRGFLGREGHMFDGHNTSRKGVGTSVLFLFIFCIDVLRL